MTTGVNTDRDAMGYVRAIGARNAAYGLLPGL